MQYQQETTMKNEKSNVKIQESKYDDANWQLFKGFILHYWRLSIRQISISTGRKFYLILVNNKYSNLVNIFLKMRFHMDE